jgi:hypothetical protein
MPELLDFLSEKCTGYHSTADEWVSSHFEDLHNSGQSWSADEHIRDYDSLAQLLRRPRAIRILGLTPVASRAKRVKLIAPDLEVRFRKLAEQWRRQTKFRSAIEDKAIHPAYQSIIAMGPQVIPLVLRDLRDSRGHWFWALHYLAGKDMAEGSTTIDQARDTWLRWGEDNGYI